jgi:hypothetical protein
MNLSLPLFRNAGEDTALENLRQADRNCSTRCATSSATNSDSASTSRFGSCVRRAREAGGNEERNLQRLRETRERNEALAEAQRLTEIQVDQARQNELDAQSRVLLAKNRFQNSQDDFKELIGLPVDLVIDVDPAELVSLEVLMTRGIPVDESSAMRQGLRLRLRPAKRPGRSRRRGASHHRRRERPRT